MAEVQAAALGAASETESDRVGEFEVGQTNRRLLQRAFTGFFGQRWLVTERRARRRRWRWPVETEVELTDRDGREFRGSRPQLPMQVTIAGRRSSAAGRGRLLHRECWPQGMRRLEAIGGRSGLGKPMPNRSPTTRCNNTTTAASTLPGHGSRARAAARHHADCPVSPLTQLCPLSSAPFSIVKSMYLGQVSSQVSAVFVCL